MPHRQIPRVRRTVTLASAILAAAALAACDGGGGTEPWNVTSLSVSPTEVTLEVGETVRITATVVSTGTAGTTAWRSSRSEVALVDDQGLVTAISPGVAVVTATAGDRQASSTITVGAPLPTAPGGVSAVPASHTRVDVSWTDSEFETSFVVERAEGPGGSQGYAEVGTVGTGSTAFADEGLEPGTSYRYRVSACNDVGCSEPAGPADVTTDEELVVTTTALADGVVEQPYDDVVEAAGGGPSRAWDVTAGALPPGLLLDASSGGVSGTPTTAGDFAFTVQVSSRGQTATAALSLRVEGTAGLSAVAFEDGDRDGARGGGEAGVAGVEITLADIADPEASVTVTTGADGAVDASLGPGVYRVSVAPTGEWIGDPPVLSDLEIELVEGETVQAELPMVRGGQAVVGPAGGMVVGPDGGVLTVPEGALEEPTTLSLLPVQVPVAGGDLPGIELHPAGLVFDGFAELVLPGVGAGGAGTFFHLDDATGDALALPTVVDAGAPSATTWTAHFSVFFFDAASTGTLTAAGTKVFAIDAVPPSLAGNASVSEARDDVVRGVRRWTRIFSALGMTVTRNDGAADPDFRFAVRDLGACAAAGDPAGRSDRVAARDRNGTIWLNSRCLWSTSAQLARGGTPGVSLEGAVVHHVGHLLGLPHDAATACEPDGTAPACKAPPTLAVRGTGDLGPLWPADLALAGEVLGLGGDWESRGVASVAATADWVDGRELADGEALGTLPGVVVTDENGDPVPDVTVVFQRLAGGGTVAEAVAVTGPDGVARVGAWSVTGSVGDHLLAASIYRQPAQVAANEAVGALVRFEVSVLPPPPLLVEDFLPLSVGRAFTYAWESVPAAGGEAASGSGTDQIVASLQEGAVTWFEIDGDGPMGAQCGDAKCELGVDPSAGRLLLRATGGGGQAIVTTLLREPIEEGASWSDVIFVIVVNWTIVDISEAVSIQGTTYDRVVASRGGQAGSDETITLSFGEDVGLVRLVADGAEGTVTYELVGVSGG